MRSSLRAGPIVSFTLLVLLSGAVLSAQSTSATTPPASQNQADDTPCDRLGFATVFTCPWHDLRNVVRGESLVWLGAGALLTGGSILLDDEVRKAMTDADPDQFLAAGQTLGYAGVQFGCRLRSTLSREPRVIQGPPILPSRYCARKSSTGF